MIGFRNRKGNGNLVRIMTIVPLTPEPLILSSLLFPEVAFVRWWGRKTEVIALKVLYREWWRSRPGATAEQAGSRDKGVKGHWCVGKNQREL